MKLVQPQRRPVWGSTSPVLQQATPAPSEATPVLEAVAKFTAAITTSQSLLVQLMVEQQQKLATTFLEALNKQTEMFARLLDARMSRLEEKLQSPSAHLESCQIQTSQTSPLRKRKQRKISIQPVVIADSSATQISSLSPFTPPSTKPLQSPLSAKVLSFSSPLLEPTNQLRAAPEPPTLQANAPSQPTLPSINLLQPASTDDVEITTFT